MCGLAGWVMRGCPQGGPDTLRRMIQTIIHRGPDGLGSAFMPQAWGEYDVALGHCRLSIIDLAGGRQPMQSLDGKLTLVYNGELYNFRELRAELQRLGHAFLTDSDTEVVLQAYRAWGDRCVERFRGMFAFALWDREASRLVLARDPFGKKPLVYYEGPQGVVFASEIKALLAFPGVPINVDHQAVWEYLAYRYVPGPATLFAGIRKLPPGTVAIWSNGRLQERRYYDPPDRSPQAIGSPGIDPVGHFREQLDEAVRIRMVSDVPFGAFLSGGIDSAAVTGLMAQHSGFPIKTFSVGFQERRYSELAYARLVATHFHTEHHELVIDERHVLDELPRLVQFRDAPVAEPSDIPIYLLAEEARKSVKMVLTGEGSDEILGGYPKHVYERYVARYQYLPTVLREGMVEPLVRSLPYRFRRVKTAMANFGLPRAEDRYPRWFGALSPTERDALVQDPALRSCSAASAPRPFPIQPGSSRLREILYFDQVSWLPDNLLERGDRMTMAASLEARMPFMDTQLAAYVSSLPDRYRVRGHCTKWILRESMKGFLPGTILERPKVGFRVPVNEWFRGPMKAYLYDHLTGPSSQTRGYYHPRLLDQLLDDHIRGRQNHEKVLWTLLNLEIWHRAYVGQTTPVAA